MPNPLAKKETIALFFFMFIEEEGALLLGKTIQKYSHQLINPASLEDISEIIFDLCSVVSFTVLCLVLYFTTNIRTLELTLVFRTVSCRSSFLVYNLFDLERIYTFVIHFEIELFSFESSDSDYYFTISDEPCTFPVF